MKTFDITDPSAGLKARIWETLRTIPDPELNVNIVDLGLIYGIDISGQQITITMTLSSKFCPMGDAILQSVENCLEHNYPEYAIKVVLTWVPEWGYDKITEEGLKLLGR